MSTSWVAGVVRARAMGCRRLGRAGVRALAASPTVDAAVETVTLTPYGHDVRIGHDLAQAQRAVTDSLLWNLRVLAGWLPAGGAEQLRVLAGWFELTNVDELMRSLDGAAAESPYRMGTLATAWPQLAGATSAGDLRARLGWTTWGDPGGDHVRDVQLSMRLVWAERVAVLVPPTADLAAAAAALLLARELPQGRLPAPAAAAAARLLGPAAVAASTLPALATALPGATTWALQDVATSADLWLAETRWWHRVEETALGLARSASFGPAAVLGAVGLLAVDCWRVRAALSLAGRPAVAEVLDAVA